MSHDRINLGRRKQEGTPKCQINLRNRKAVGWSHWPNAADLELKYNPPHGMTLRDWFAGQAMIAIIAATSAGQHRVLFGDNGDSIETAMAKDAYQVADAMIAARKGGAA